MVLCMFPNEEATNNPAHLDAYKPHQGPAGHNNPKCYILTNILYQ